MTAFKRRDLEQYRASISQYYPGDILFAAKDIPGKNLHDYLLGLAHEFFNVNGYIRTYTDDISPEVTEKYLSEWETAVGIPDECFEVAADDATRRRNIIGKLARMAVQTADEMVEMGAYFGFAITITPGILDTSGATAGLTDDEKRFVIVTEFFGVSEIEVFPYTFPFTFGASDDATDIMRCILEAVIPSNVGIRYNFNEICSITLLDTRPTAFVIDYGEVTSGNDVEDLSGPSCNNFIGYKFTHNTPSEPLTFTSSGGATTGNVNLFIWLPGNDGAPDFNLLDLPQPINQAITTIDTTGTDGEYYYAYTPTDINLVSTGVDWAYSIGGSAVCPVFILTDYPLAGQTPYDFTTTDGVFVTANNLPCGPTCTDIATVAHNTTVGGGTEVIDAFLSASDAGAVGKQVRLYYWNSLTPTTETLQSTTVITLSLAGESLTGGPHFLDIVTPNSSHANPKALWAIVPEDDAQGAFNVDLNIEYDSF